MLYFHHTLQLPATGETALFDIPSIRQTRLQSFPRLISEKPPIPRPNLKRDWLTEFRNRAALELIDNNEAEAKAKAEAKLRELELEKLREDLEVTDDMVNSEAKLHALFLKWLSYFDHHFDVEDEKAFRFRFGIFKDAARSINQWNKGGHASTCGLNKYADMTRKEFATWSWKTYPKKTNQVIADITNCLDNKKLI